MSAKREQRPSDGGMTEYEPDEYTGIGGTYIRDPKTGKRRPLIDSESEPPASAPPNKTERSEE